MPAPLHSAFQSQLFKISVDNNFPYSIEGIPFVTGSVTIIPEQKRVSITLYTPGPVCPPNAMCIKPTPHISTIEMKLVDQEVQGCNVRVYMANAGDGRLGQKEEIVKIYDYTYSVCIGMTPGAATYVEYASYTNSIK